LHCCPRSARIAGIILPGFVEAYLWTYGNARSRAGARASTSRLMKRRDVRAAMQWFYAQLSHEIPADELMPDTVSRIRNRLAELGNWRARFG
jgi:hypothetical protein